MPTRPAASRAAAALASTTLRRRAVLPRQHAAHRRGARLGTVSAQLIQPARRQAEIGGRPFQSANCIATHFPYLRRRRQADFIESIAAVNHQGVACVQEGERPGHEVKQFATTNTQQLMRGAGGVGQRPQAVEQRADAELAADVGDVAQGGMEVRREAEGEVAAFEAAAGEAGVAVDPDAQGGEHVGAAATAGDGAVAVLDHRHAHGGDDEGGGGADVERGRAIAAGAAGVQHAIATGLPAEHVFAQHPGGGGQFRGRLALHAQRHEKASGLGIGALAGHHRVQDGAQALLGQLAALQQGGEHLSEPGQTWRRHGCV